MFETMAPKAKHYIFIVSPIRLCKDASTAQHLAHSLQGVDVTKTCAKQTNWRDSHKNSGKLRTTELNKCSKRKKNKDDHLESTPWQCWRKSNIAFKRNETNENQVCMCGKKEENCTKMTIIAKYSGKLENVAFHQTNCVSFVCVLFKTNTNAVVLSWRLSSTEWGSETRPMPSYLFCTRLLAMHIFWKMAESSICVRAHVHIRCWRYKIDMWLYWWHTSNSILSHSS